MTDVAILGADAGAALLMRGFIRAGWLCPGAEVFGAGLGYSAHDRRVSRSCV